MADQTVKPLILFKEELTNEQLSIRVNTIRKLSIILPLISNNNSQKEELIAFLEQYVFSCDEDEVVFGFAESMQALVQFYPIQKLLIFYEKLLSSDETVIREKAIESFLKLAAKMTKTEITNVLIPFINRCNTLAVFGMKMSSLAIMSECFALFNPAERKVILEKITGLLTEDSLVLKRNIAARLGKLCKNLPKEVLITELLPHFKNLANDDSDSVRIITIESLVELAESFTDDDNKTHLVPIIIQMTGDKSWRVRYNLAKIFWKLTKSVGPEITDSILFSIFSTFLRDHENEVRIVAIRSLREFVNLLNSDRLNTAIGLLQNLAKDPIALVRIGVCEVLLKILMLEADKIGKDGSKAKIMPIIADLSSDKDTEVKIEVLKIFPVWTKWTGPFVIEQLSSGMYPLGMDAKNWRIRVGILEAMFKMSAELKNPKVFEKNVWPVILTGITDKVYEVRNFINKSLKLLMSTHNESVITNSFLTEFIATAKNQSHFYAIRVTAIYGIESVFVASNNKDSIKDTFMNSMVIFTKDPNNNVRFVAVKVLHSLATQKPFSEYNDFAKKVFTDIKDTEKDCETKFLISDFLN